MWSLEPLHYEPVPFRFFFGHVLRYVISLSLALSFQNTDRITHETLRHLAALSGSRKSDRATSAHLPSLDLDKTKRSKFR